MALVFAEGFDANGTSGTFNPRKFWQRTIPNDNAIVAGRIAGQACRCRDWLWTNNLGNQLTYVVGFAYQPLRIITTFGGGGNVAGQNFLTFFGDLFAQFFLVLNPCMQIEVWGDGVGTTENFLGRGTRVLREDQWYYIECKGTADPSSGSVEVRVAGVTDISVTGVRTISDESGSPTYYNAFLWKGDNNTVTISGAVSPAEVTSNFAGDGPYVDDIYICDTTGGVNDDFLGDVYVETIFPNGVGNSSGWTSSTGGANYTNVDEQNVNDDTDYNSATSVVTDTYAFQNLSVNTIVNAVQPFAIARFDDGGPHEIALVVRPGSTDNIGISQSMPFQNNGNDGSTYLGYYDPFDNNPDTASAWTASEVDASEFGMRYIS